MAVRSSIMYQYDDRGTPVISCASEADGDWLKARRLLLKGTKKAKKELEEMENSPLEILQEDAE